MTDEIQAIEPVVRLHGGAIIADSRDVATCFERDHKHVLQSARDAASALTAEISAQWFKPATYSVKVGFGYKDAPCFHMTRDGFTLLAMGFTGKRAMDFKIRYIEAFNRMEAELRDGAKSALSVNQQLRIVAEARKTLGVKAAAKVWRDVGLPMPTGAAQPATSDDDVSRVYAAIARTGSATYREIYRRCKTIRAHWIKLALGRLEQEGRIVCQKQCRGTGWPLRTYHVVKPGYQRAIAPNEADQIDQVIFKAARVSGGASKTAIYRAARQRGWSNETLMDRINSLVREGLLRVSCFHHGPSGGRPLTIYHASAQ